jgi:hypothetical protein
MNTFTAQELADFYQKVADGGEIEVSLIVSRHFEGYKGGPNLSCLKDSFSIKPTKKVIDLSVLIESGIDCEVTNNSLKTNNWEIRQLQSIYSDGNSGWPYRTEKGTHEKCRPRMNHKHAWESSERPIEGFIVRAWFDKKDFLTVFTSSNSIDWKKIIYVEFLEPEDGYVMPWESE